MKKIRLSRSEKAALRNIVLDCGYLPDNMSEARFSACVAALESVGLVRTAWAAGHEICAVELTDFGRAYMQENPHLNNPVDWPKIGAIAAAVVAIAAIVALFVACSSK